MNRLTKKFEKAFSLAELLAALIISTLVLVSAIGVYARMRQSAGQLNERIDQTQLPREILQRIAEDIDKTIGPVSEPKPDISISVKNKLDELYQSAQLKISRTYYDNENQEKIFEEITWQSNYDYDANSLVLYRSHQGLTVEDKLLEENKEKWQRELFVPVADGLTCFRIEAHKGVDFVDKWQENSLPPAIRVTLSLSPPYKDIEGKLEVNESEKITRTIALNRARQIRFQFIAPDYDELFSEPDEPDEPNEIPDNNIIFTDKAEAEAETEDALEKFLKSIK